MNYTPQGPFPEKIMRRIVTVDIPPLADEQRERLLSAARSGSFEPIQISGDMEALKQAIAEVVEEVGKDPLRITVGYNIDDYINDRISALITFADDDQHLHSHGSI